MVLSKQYVQLISCMLVSLVIIVTKPGIVQGCVWPMNCASLCLSDRIRYSPWFILTDWRLLMRSGMSLRFYLFCVGAFMCVRKLFFFLRPCVRKFRSHPSLPFCLLDMWGGGCHVLHHVSSRRSVFVNLTTFPLRVCLCETRSAISTNH